MEAGVMTNDGSDYGFYGKTGCFPSGKLPITKCACSPGPMLDCEYDGTPGYRETVYRLYCDVCGLSTRATCIIENVINEWNSILEKAKCPRE